MREQLPLNNETQYTSIRYFWHFDIFIYEQGDQWKIFSWHLFNLLPIKGRDMITWQDYNQERLGICRPALHYPLRKFSQESVRHWNTRQGDRFPALEEIIRHLLFYIQVLVTSTVYCVNY